LRSKTIELNFAGDEVEERKTALDERDLELLKSRVTQQMSGAKLYLEPGLTLNDLSRKLGVNTTVLSFTINNGFGKNFNDFVNEFRIEDVKKMLLSGKAENENLLAIAFDCGFNSKATFNRAFKKFTGLSPKEFLESNLKSK
jgi:AraC-like DNA-binding protein